MGVSDKSTSLPSLQFHPYNRLDITRFLLTVGRRRWTGPRRRTIELTLEFPSLPLPCGRLRCTQERWLNRYATYQDSYALFAYIPAPDADSARVGRQQEQRRRDHQKCRHGITGNARQQ